MSKRIPQSFIDDLLTRVDIVELINRHVPLKKNGRNYSACCPFHQEKTASFTVSENKQFYHCFGCGAHGSAISFLMEYERYEFLEAIEELAKQTGLTVPKSHNQNTQNKALVTSQKVLDKAAKLYHAFLQRHADGEKARDYLTTRGISTEIQEKFAIGFAPPGWDTLSQYFKNQPQKLLIDAGLLVSKDNGRCYDRFRDRVIFPIRNRRGMVIGFGGRVLDDSLPKYLNSPETSLFQKNRELYGLHEAYKAIHEQHFALIVEGYMDVVSLAQHGICNAVATLGTASNQLHFEALFKLTSDIVCCFDGDKAGYNAAWRALESALPILRDGRQIKFMFLAEGEDPDSMVAKQGQANFLQEMKTAMPLAEFFISHLSEGIDLEDVAGRVRLAKRAVTLLKTMPNGLHKDALLDELAKQVDMDHRRIEALSEEQSDKSITSKPKSKQHKKPSTIRLAIALLLQNPNLIEHVTEDFSVNTLALPGKDILMTLIDLLHKNPQLNSAALLENWRGQAEQAQLAKLLLWDSMLPESGLALEFQGALDQINSQQRQQQIENLLDKANQIGLNDQERNTLQQLIKEKEATKII